MIKTSIAALAISFAPIAARADCISNTIGQTTFTHCMGMPTTTSQQIGGFTFEHQGQPYPQPRQFQVRPYGGQDQNDDDE